MQKLLKLKVWITIVLLSCFINSFATNDDYIRVGSLQIPSTGGRDSLIYEVPESVLISYNDIRLANVKLIRLEYTEEINNKLRDIISNDSIIIKNYKDLNVYNRKRYKKVKTQRNIAIGIAGLMSVLSLLALIK